MSEQYAIEFKPTARRDLSKVSAKILTAAVEFIYSGLAENPYRVGKPLLAPFAGEYPARRGSYRIVYSINHDRQASRSTASSTVQMSNGTTEQCRSSSSSY